MLTLRSRRCRAAVLLAATCAIPLAWSEDGKHATHRFEFEFGIGYDSNPTLAPSTPYVDQNSGDTIRPVVQSSLVAPLRLAGHHLAPFGDGWNAMVTSYEARGEFFVESLANSADETFARFAPGFRFGFADPDEHERHLTLTPFVSFNKELYFDRDTGFEASTGGQDVSDRYTYTALGSEVGLVYEAARFLELELEGLYESRSYEKVEGLEAFDHDRLRAEAGAAIRFSRHVRLSLDYGYQLRDYAERRARSLDGESDDANPLLDYGYTDARATLRIAPTRSWYVEASLKQTDREDRFAGYNDYSQETLRLRTSVRTEKLRLRVGVKSWERTFERAFIFDEPFDIVSGAPNPLKAYEGVESELTAEWIFPRIWRFVAGFRHTEQDTADPRLSFDRDQVRFALVFAP